MQNSPKNEGGELTADYRYSKEGVLGTCSSRVLQNSLTGIARLQSFSKALSDELLGKEYGIPDKSSLERPKKMYTVFHALLSIFIKPERCLSGQKEVREYY